MRKRILSATLISSVALCLFSGPTAAIASSGTGSATPTDGLVHHRTFDLGAARRQVVRYERGWPARIGSCHWLNRWEAACSVHFKGAIFTQASSPAVYIWTDLVAVNQPLIRPYVGGKWSIERINLRQVGTILVY